MGEKESLLLRALGSPQLRIVDFLLDNKPFDFSKKEIIEELGMSKTTFYRVWKELEALGIVKVSRKFGKTRLYKINEENELVKSLMEIERLLISKASEKWVKKAVAKGDKIRPLYKVQEGLICFSFFTVTNF